MNKSVNNIFLIIVISLLFIQCDQEIKGISEGEIYYDISYPCLENNHESMLFLLPALMSGLFWPLLKLIFDHMNF